MTSERTGSEIRRGLLAGESEAVRVVQDWISRLVRGGGWRLGDREAAIQEITLRLLHLGRTGRIRDDTNFKRFVHTVARHTCTDIYRRERLRKRIEEPGTDLDQTAIDDPGPHGSLERRERRELLRFIVWELPSECRRLWQLVYVDGQSATQVAEQLGISAGTARVRVHRCLEKAREIRQRYEAGIASEEST